MPPFMPVLLLFACIAAAFSLPAYLLVKRRKLEQRQKTDRIVALQRKIDAVLRDDAFETARESFNASLKAASLTTNLQRPRLDNLAKIDKQPPEKYRILGKLVSQGMDAEEIASILGISRMEAIQLLSLSNVANFGH